MQSTPNFVKVSTNLSGRFRLLKKHDEAPILYGNLDAEGFNHADLLHGTNIPDNLVKFLVNIDNKLNSILSVLKKEQIDQRFPHQLNALKLSGGELSFSSAEKLKLGDFIEAMVFLEDFPPRSVGVIGKIIKTQIKDEANFYDLEFTNISESEQDQIVQYVFQIERRMLRSKNNL